MKIIVDTSIWIDYLNDRPIAHVQALDDLLSGDAMICTTPPVLQEILQGASTRERQNAWQRRFARVPCLAFHDPSDGAVAAAQLHLACRLAGFTPRSSNDCLIACIAVEQGASLLHNDRDFEHIAKVESRLHLHGRSSP